MPCGNGYSPAARLLIVSNRLPVTITTPTPAAVAIERSSGGLGTAMARTHETHDSLWIGWPGGPFRAAMRKQIAHLLQDQHPCVLVFLSAEAIRRYDDGFSNRALRPLCHSFPALPRGRAAGSFGAELSVLPLSRAGDRGRDGFPLVRWASGDLSGPSYRY